MSNTNKACCSIPPVTTHNYQAKGAYETFEDMQVYSIGEKNQKTIICIFDIFGFYPQVLQGADLLAALGFRVVIPDFFRGKPFPSEKFPPFESPLKHGPTTDEDKKQFQDFFSDAGRPDLRLPELLRVAAWVKAAGAPSVGVYGLCWGAKVAIMAGGQDPAVFSSVAQAHPAMLSVDDFEALKVPIATYISQDEEKDVAEQGIKIANAKPFGKKNDFKVYPDMHHGFAGSRSNLADPAHLAGFEDVYQRLATFFKATL